MKKIAYASCLGVIAMLTTEFGVIGMLPQIAAFYHITIDHAGLLLSLFALVIAVAGPFVTILTTGIDRKLLMLATLFLFLLSNLLSATAPPFWVLVMLRILPAFLHPVYYATALRTVSSGNNRKEGHRLMALVLSGISIATVSAIPLSAYLSRAGNWPASFLSQAVISLFALIAIGIWVPWLPVTQRATVGSQVRVIFKADFLLSSVIIFMLISSWFCTYGYLADFLHKTREMTADMVGLMMFVFGASGILGNWIAGKTMTRWRTGTTMSSIAGTVIIAAGFQLTAPTLPATIGIVILWGFCYAPIYFISSATISSAAPEAVEFANSIATSVTNLGITVGTMAGGFVIRNLDIKLTPWAGVAFAIASAILVVFRDYRNTRATHIVQKATLS